MLGCLGIFLAYAEYFEHFCCIFVAYYAYLFIFASCAYLLNIFMHISCTLCIFIAYYAYLWHIVPANCIFSEFFSVKLHKLLELGMKSAYILHKICFILFNQPQAPGAQDRAPGPPWWGTRDPGSVLPSPLPCPGSQPRLDRIAACLCRSWRSQARSCRPAVQ